jgi:hypothetical protein
MNQIFKYGVGTGGIIINLCLGITSIIAAIMSSNGYIPVYLIFYNIPLIPGYVLIGFGLGRYVMIANILFQNLLYPYILSTISMLK